MHLRRAFKFPYSRGGNISDKLGYIIRLVRNSVQHMGKLLRFVGRLTHVNISKGTREHNTASIS